MIQLVPQLLCMTLNFFRRNHFEKVKSVTTVTILEEECNIDLKVESKKPALIGEWFPIKITLVPKEDISNVILTTDCYTETNMVDGKWVEDSSMLHFQKFLY